MHDIPPRHRSMRSVFNHSWELLGEDEKSILKKLTVFRGGFSHEAAEIIAGATAVHLHALVNRSLLYSVEDEHYDLHNLVRQFAHEKLAQNPSSIQDTCNAHCLYFASYVKTQEAVLYGLNPIVGQQNILQEIENIRASWLWAVKQLKIAPLAQSARALGRFYNMRSWFTEGREVFSKTLKTLLKIPDHDDDTAQLVGEISIHLGWFEVQLGNYQNAILILERPLKDLRRIQAQREVAATLNILGSAVFELGELESARNHFEESLSISQKEELKSEAAFANNYLGSINRNQGDFEQAQSFFLESLQTYQQLGDRWGVAQVLNNLGNMAGISGDYPAAKEFFEESLAVRQKLDDQAGIAGCLQNLSILAFLDEDYGKAKKLRQECLAICRKIGFTWGITSTLKHLGDVEKATGNFHEAAKHYQESLSISEQNNDPRSMAFTLNSLGGLALQQGELEQALDYYQRAFQTAMEIEVLPLAIDVLLGIATLFIEKEQYQQSLERILFALNHPSTEKQTLQRANQLKTMVDPFVNQAELACIKKQVLEKTLKDFLMG
jgi:tetratricopeptide (TPR) repeat protein